MAGQPGRAGWPVAPCAVSTRRQSCRDTAGIALAALALAAGLAGCKSVPEPAYAGDPAAGREAARNLCASRHAIGPTGASPNPRAIPMREMLSRPPADELLLILRTSTPVSYLHMPQFFLVERTPDDLVAYMKSPDR